MALAAVPLATSAWGQPADEAVAYRNYVLNCMGCHGASGEGVPGNIPPLRGAIGLFVHSSAGRQFIVRVPGASNSALTDDELAAVTNLMLARFGANQLPADFRPYTGSEVAALRRPAYADVATVRHAVIEELRGRGVPMKFDY
ncbi:cytochrome c (plasmid) [Cupriavidus pinatubonensis]|nr:cytochrome c [Cupriavidus pinatubonensis]